MKFETWARENGVQLEHENFDGRCRIKPELYELERGLLGAEAQQISAEGRSEREAYWNLLKHYRGRQLHCLRRGAELKSGMLAEELVGKFAKIFLPNDLEA